MKALLIPVDGKPHFSDIPDDLHGMQSVVGGYLEVVGVHDLRPDMIMVIDEEGKLKGKPVNRLASMIYCSPWDHIVGDAFIVKRGYVAGEPDLVGLSPSDCAWLIPALDLDTF